MRASFSPQSELGIGLRISSGLLRRDLLSYPLYHVCSPGHQRDMLTWRHPRLPPRIVRPNHIDFGTLYGAVSPDTCNRQRGLRSFPHLREQLKPRTDDGHASPAYASEESSGFPELSCRFQVLVRFFAYHRIKPRDPPLVRVPVYSFEF